MKIKGRSVLRIFIIVARIEEECSYWISISIEWFSDLDAVLSQI